MTAIAPVPAAWQALIPRAGVRSIGHALDLEFAPTQDQHTLRERLRATCKSKRGDGWACLRRAAQGERMFRLVNGPGDPSLPCVDGVDDFVSKSLLFALAGSVAPDGALWHETAPEDIALLLDPSLGHLRSDCRALGHESKFTREHVAAKWIPAAQKRAAEHRSAAEFVARLLAGTSEAERAAVSGLPLILQLDSAYYVLDDRDGERRPPVYQGPVGSTAIVALARQLWLEHEPPRPLDVPKTNGVGTCPMVPAQAVQTYGRVVTQVVTELCATVPRVEDLALIKPGISPVAAFAAPMPAHDPDVAEWLELLAGTPKALALVTHWIQWAAVPHLSGVSPALVLVGAPQVGKDLFACAIPRAAGLDSCTSLTSALQQFNTLASHPYVFSNEGIPRGAGGHPRTEEFRDLCTRSQHLIEVKNANARQPVRGGVRVVLAANRIDRLFANRGHLNADDVEALVRRLIVIDVGTQGTDRALELKRRAQALGAFENDPTRLDRVAAHFRYLQAIAPTDLKEPAPFALALRAELRKGGDLAGAALAVLEDAAASLADWIAVDPSAYAGAPGGVVWVRPDAWGRASESPPAPLLRAVASYIVRPVSRMRRHPVTGAAIEPAGPGRARWVGLDLGALIADGVALEHET